MDELRRRVDALEERVATLEIGGRRDTTLDTVAPHTGDQEAAVTEEANLLTGSGRVGDSPQPAERTLVTIGTVGGGAPRT